MKVIFILGSGHCGSTLLDLILDSHSKIVGLGQCEKIGVKKTCACGKDFSECNFWSDIIKNNHVFFNSKINGIYRSKINFIFNKERYFIKNKKKAIKKNDYIEMTEFLYELALNKSNSSVIVDSSKNPDRVLALLRSKKIEPVVVHIVRDGRGVLWSYLKKKKKALPYLWKWVVSNLKVEALRRRTRIPYVFVGYSQFSKDPEKEIKKILNQVDLVFEKEMINFRQFSHHQAAGNKLRFGGDEKIKEDLEWQRKLPKKYNILFLLFFGWLNWYYKNKKN